MPLPCRSLSTPTGPKVPVGLGWIASLPSGGPSQNRDQNREAVSSDNSGEQNRLLCQCCLASPRDDHRAHSYQTVFGERPEYGSLRPVLFEKRSEQTHQRSFAMIGIGTEHPHVARVVTHPAPQDSRCFSEFFKSEFTDGPLSHGKFAIRAESRISRRRFPTMRSSPGCSVIETMRSLSSGVPAVFSVSCKAL